jgi:Zn-dependent peptidase ImmA (M78 family)
MIIGPGFRGERLRLARLANALSLAELGVRLGVTRQYVHGLEIGTKNPGSETVAALAFALRVTPAFFARPATEDLQPDQCHFRHLKSTPQVARAECAARGTLLEELVHELEQVVALPKVDLPVTEVSDATSIETAAQITREHWKLGLGPVANMCTLLERAGVLVSDFGQLSQRVDAFSSDRARPLVVRNGEKGSACRWRFDLAHELGHLILHRGTETGDDFTETQADQFAGAFLLPRRPFVIEFPRNPLTEMRRLFELKLRWGVSVAAILYRAKELHLIDPAQYKIAQIRLRKSGQSKSELYDDRVEREAPTLLAHAFHTACQLGLMTIAQLQESLCMTKHLVGDLLGVGLTDGEAIEDHYNVVQLQR